MHRLRMTALAGVLALSTSGSDSSKTPFQPDLTAFFPKKTAQPTNQKPEYPVGLIETTNIQQRLKQIQQGQSDPFTRLFPTEFVETATKPEKIFPDLPKLPVINKLPAPTPTVKASPKVTPPNTDLASGVVVEGVVQIGSQAHAIVKLPTDGTSRYVSEGQHLSSGQLLVKKIEISPDSEPVVILEQNGIEISKAVGEQTDESTDTIASSTLTQIGSDYKASHEKSSDEVSSNSQAAQSVASSRLTQIGSDRKTSHEESSEETKKQAAEPQQVTQQEEYTPAIAAPTVPPSSYSSQKKPPGKVAVAPPTNSIAPTDTAALPKG